MTPVWLDVNPILRWFTGAVLVLSVTLLIAGWWVVIDLACDAVQDWWRARRIRRERRWLDEMYRNGLEW